MDLYLWFCRPVLLCLWLTVALCPYNSELLFERSPFFGNFTIRPVFQRVGAWVLLQITLSCVKCLWRLWLMSVQTSSVLWSSALILSMPAAFLFSSFAMAILTLSLLGGSVLLSKMFPVGVISVSFTGSYILNTSSEWFSSVLGCIPDLFW